MEIYKRTLIFGEQKSLLKLSSEFELRDKTSYMLREHVLNVTACYIINVIFCHIANAITSNYPDCRHIYRCY